MRPLTKARLLSLLLILVVFGGLAWLLRYPAHYRVPEGAFVEVTVDPGHEDSVAFVYATDPSNGPIWVPVPGKVEVPGLLHFSLPEGAFMDRWFFIRPGPQVAIGEVAYFQNGRVCRWDSGQVAHEFLSEATTFPLLNGAGPPWPAHWSVGPPVPLRNLSPPRHWLWAFLAAVGIALLAIAWRTTSPRSLLRRAFAGLMVVGLCVPVVEGWSWVRNGSYEEFRLLQEVPQVTQTDPWRWLKNTGNAYEDRMPWRSRAHRWMAETSSRSDHLRAIPPFSLGRDNWLLEPQTHVVASPSGWVLPDAVQQKNLRARVQQLSDWSDSLDLLVVVVLIPDKEMVYPEHLPDSSWLVERSLHQEVRTALSAVPNVRLIDLTAPLLSHKSTGPLYFRTDTHWNEAGAFLGYEVIMDSLGRWLELGPALARRDMQQINRPTEGGNLVRPFWAEGLSVGRESVPLLFAPPIEGMWFEYPPAGKSHADAGIHGHSQANDLEVLWFGDSFSHSLFPLLSRHIGHTWFVEQPYPDPAYFVQSPPDVLVIQVVDRFLLRWLEPLPQATP